MRCAPNEYETGYVSTDAIKTGYGRRTHGAGHRHQVAEARVTELRLDLAQAVVNEDHQGDAVVLQGEVRRLREELSIFRTLHTKVRTRSTIALSWCT